MNVRFHIVVAYSQNRAIGKENKLLWHLTDDMKFFKKLTIGKTVLMGRKTYESLPERFRPLPNRKNLVLSASKPIEHKENLFWIGDDQKLKEYCQHNPLEDIYIVGGGEIYRKFLPIADTIYATEVETTIEADTFFPQIDHSEWISSKIESHPKTEFNDYSFEILKYTRKK